ncbi:MAG: FAD-binding oxidoreductase [Myxococcaceae bacterium]|nr:FAD-binding oxidoreductase [Myxococcaceae bacterium]
MDQLQPGTERPRGGQRPVVGPSRPDERALEEALRRVVQGEVRFDAQARAMYAVDGSNYRQVPIGVVVPKTVEDVVATVAACRRFGAPVLSRGGGTSLAGQCCNVAVVIDWSKHLNRILEIDPERQSARVQPGLVLDVLRKAARAHGLTFGPDPATHTHCTIGGMLGNNSCGTHAQQAGRMAENVRSLEVLTWDGLRLKVGPTSDEMLQEILRAGGRRAEIYRGLIALRDRYADEVRARFPNIPRRVSGYCLEQLLPENGFNVARLLVGSESTLVTILEAELELIPEPKARALVVVGFDGIEDAADHVPMVLESAPIALEGIDGKLIAFEKLKRMNPESIPDLPPGDGWLMAEFGGDSQKEADQKALDLIDLLERRLGRRPPFKRFDVEAEAQDIWQIREAGLGATARVPNRPDSWEGWEDAAVHPDRLGAYLRDFRRLLTDFGYDTSLYGHFGQGCVHCRIDFDYKTAEGISRYRAFVEAAADLVVRYGGSLSGEHGDGQSRAELLPKMYGERLVRAFGELKAIWDPHGKMNPGKVVFPYRLDENLRFGVGYAPKEPKTHFAYREDDGSFIRAAERCVGVGKCRRLEGGTMCPSYRVTRDEQHSTRGRAHLLWEMLRGDVIRDGWRSEAVKDALDLCLACKGCKSDCPVNVDMATYKAEFLSHYYAHHPRPLNAYAFGLVMYAARVAGRVPGLADLGLRTPGLSAWMKRVLDVAPERALPLFGAPSFQRRVRRRARRNEGGPRVVLYPDTFNNYFHPETAMAALDVLEAAGFDVHVPRQATCCGRPLYDYGMLGEARRQLRRVLDTFREEIRGGVPFVVLEPSCASVFRDELKNLFPHDLDAERLARQTFVLSELLRRHAPGFVPPALEGPAVVHGHCHHKSVLGFDDEKQLISDMKLDAQFPDTGCCGMAGAFGFEKDKYAVSMACGEQVLFPAVRAAPPGAELIADGFSCRTQLEHGVGLRADHLAEVIREGLWRKRRLPPGSPRRHAHGARRAMIRAKVALGVAAVMAALTGVRALRRARV